VVQRDQGFGFIISRTAARTASSTHSAIRSVPPTLAEGNRAELDVVQGRKGPAAENVVKIG